MSQRDVDPVLDRSFSLSSIVGLEVSPSSSTPRRIGEVDLYSINPIFASRHRELLAGGLDLLGLTCLLYALPPSQPGPDVIEVMQQVPPRPLLAPKAEPANFALFAFTKRTAWGLRRKAVNSRVSLMHMLLRPFALAHSFLPLLCCSDYSGGVIRVRSIGSRATPPPPIPLFQLHHAPLAWVRGSISKARGRRYVLRGSWWPALATRPPCKGVNPPCRAGRD